MVFIVNRSGTRKDHRSSAFVPGNVPRSSRISWPISVNGARSMQGEVAYSYCARNGCLRNIRNAATDGHSISGKLVTRAIHATDIPRRDRYIRSAARFTPTRRYCVYTCTIHRRNIDNWPLMASSEIRDTGCSSNILRSNACTTAWIILRFVLLHACKLID